MELRVLKYFLMVAREENITRAAKLLNITQPTLSRQLMNLEEELGVKLFERTSHQILLTNEGMLLKRRAREIVSLSERVKSELIQDEENLSGVISIGSGELLSMDELSEWIAAFRERHPLVHFELYSATADRIKRQMEEGLLDLGLLLEPVDISKFAFLRMKTKESWCALVPEDSPLAEKGYVCPEDLLAYPVLLPGRESIQNELLSWLGDYAEKIHCVGRFNLIYNAAAAARTCKAVILATKLNCSYDGLICVPLRPALSLGSVIAWKERQILTPVVSAFVDFMRNAQKA